MSERRVTVPVKYGVDQDDLRQFGLPTMDATVQVQTTQGVPWATGYLSRLWQARVALLPGDSGFTVYQSGAGATLTFPVRLPGGLRVIDAVEVHQDVPAGTSVGWRVLLRTNVEYYWTGAAWALATNPANHWSTAAQVETNLPSVDKGLARQGLTLRCSLRTTDAKVTPRVYGVAMAWECHLTDTAGARRGTSVGELQLALVQWLKALTVAASETMDSTGDTVLTFARQGDVRHDVVGVDAVYDVTTDPEMLTPLAGAWDGATKRYTLQAARPDGNDLHVDYRHRPTVTPGGDEDRFVDRAPIVVVMYPKTTGRQALRGQLEHRRPDGTLRVVRRPALEDLTVTIRVVADTPDEARLVMDQVVGYAQPGSLVDVLGPSLRMPSTDTPVVPVVAGPPGEVSQRGDLWQTDLDLRVSRYPVWNVQGVDAVGVQEVPVAPADPSLPDSDD